MEYRVIIEEYNDKDRLCHRVEVRQPTNPGLDNEQSLGVALAGAVSGMCVYDFPLVGEVVAQMLWRIDFGDNMDPFNALGEAAIHWWNADDPPEFRDVCEVAVRSDFMDNPMYASKVDRLTRSKE